MIEIHLGGLVALRLEDQGGAAERPTRPDPRPRVSSRLGRRTRAASPSVPRAGTGWSGRGHCRTPAGRWQSPGAARGRPSAPVGAVGHPHAAGSRWRRRADGLRAPPGTGASPRDGDGRGRRAGRWPGAALSTSTHCPTAVGVDDAWPPSRARRRARGVVRPAPTERHAPVRSRRAQRPEKYDASGVRRSLERHRLLAAVGSRARCSSASAGSGRSRARRGRTGSTGTRRTRAGRRGARRTRPSRFETPAQLLHEQPRLVDGDQGVVAPCSTKKSGASGVIRRMGEAASKSSGDVGPGLLEDPRRRGSSRAAARALRSRSSPAKS